MSNNFKLLIVAIISFSLGVMATSFFKNEDLKKEHALSSNNPDISQPGTRRPFFIKVKESSNKIIQTFSKPTSKESQADPINSQEDFINLTEKLDKFKDGLYIELNKKFKRMSLDPKDISAARNNEYLKSRLEFMFMEKELWYKTSFEDDFSQSKITLFFKFLHCNNRPAKTGIQLNETCYTFQMFNFKNDKWSQVNISSQVIGLIWHNDIPYAHIELTGLGDFSKDTNAFYAVVPVPNEPLPMQYLKYESGKFSWIEGGEIKWALTSQKEINKFENWTTSYGIKHGERPE